MRDVRVLAKIGGGSVVLSQVLPFPCAYFHLLHLLCIFCILTHGVGPVATYSELSALSSQLSGRGSQLPVLSSQRSALSS
jgi:uncharacterized protein YhhL (DUF1145 family)